MSIVAVTMPKWGIEMTEGTIGDWLVAVGDTVARGDGLLEVETDKILNTVEAPAAGMLRRRLFEKGAVRPVGSLLAVCAGAEDSEVAVDAFVAAFRGERVAFEQDGESDCELAASATAKPPVESRISPIARRLAERHGVDVTQIKGTGRDGRVSKEDVEGHLAAQPSRRGAPLSSTRATIGRRLLDATQSIPHYRLSVDINATAVLARKDRLRAAHATRVSVNDLILHACARTLPAHPDVNARFADGFLERFAEANLSLAIAAPEGLVAPVIRHAERLDVVAIAAAAQALAVRARNGRLRREDVDGGSFTVSNLGMHGVTRFDAIINPPQVAILAVGAIESRVTACDEHPVVASMLTLTLSCDHRIVDGAAGAAFLTALKLALEQSEIE